MSGFLYLIRVTGSVLRPGRGTRAARGRSLLAAPLIGALLLAAGAPVLRSVTPFESELTGLTARAAHVGDFLGAIEHDYESDILPIERVLRSQRDEPELTRRIAVALVREGRRTGIEPQLLLAVLLVENPMLEPAIRNETSGAVGLMQVMPFHSGEWAPCAPDLEEIEANICHGARIFAHYLGATNGNVERALLRYNGCVRGTVTPDCHLYPLRVLAHAGRASVMARQTAVGLAASR